MAKLLFIIANAGFQDEEFWIPYTVLSEQGHHCEITSWKGGKCRGAFWTTIEKSLTFEEVQAYEYAMLIFVGWSGAYKEYFQNEKYLNLARKAKAIAAICIAPSLLSDSGLLKGKQATGWDDGFWTQIKYLQQNGAIFKDEEVVQDWNLITANGPAAATKFARTIADYLEKTF